jgi:DNA-binding NarL/FixJ family response regulator
MPHVLIVDDHPLMREAMAHVVHSVEPLAQLLGAGSLRQAEGLLATPPAPDAAIIDLQLPDGDGGQLVSLLRQRWPALPILVLTASEDGALARRLLSAGASGFAPKSAGLATLSAALRLVMAGQTYVPPLVLDLPPAGAGAPALAVPEDDGDEPADPATPGHLTPRQLAVLRLLCDGQSNKQISRALGLAERTTKVHVGAIFRALGVSNRTQAALAARALHLHQGPDAALAADALGH